MEPPAVKVINLVLLQSVNFICSVSIEPESEYTTAPFTDQHEKRKVKLHSLSTPKK